MPSDSQQHWCLCSQKLGKVILMLYHNAVVRAPHPRSPVASNKSRSHTVYMVLSGFESSDLVSRGLQCTMSHSRTRFPRPFVLSQAEPDCYLDRKTTSVSVTLLLVQRLLLCLHHTARAFIVRRRAASRRSRRHAPAALRLQRAPGAITIPGRSARRSIAVLQSDSNVDLERHQPKK